MKKICPFWVNRIDALSMESPSALTLFDLLYCDVHNSDEVWNYVLLANYMIDIQWLFREAPPLLHVTKHLFIVSGDAGLSQEFASSSLSARFDGSRVRFIQSALPLPFGVHHSKIALCVNDRGMRVAVFTANLIPDDWNKKTQGIYVQDFPRLQGAPPGEELSYSTIVEEETRGGRFKKEIRNYLNRYGVISLARNESGIPHTLLDEIDFSGAKVEIIASVPGYHRDIGAYSFGMGRLQRVLQSMKFAPTPTEKTPILTWQFSSQGKLTNTFLNTLGDAMLTDSSTLTSSKRSPPIVQVVYPTESEVQNSLEGWSGGVSLPLRLNCCHPYINERLYLWGQCKSESNMHKIARGQTIPHLKTYMRLREKRDGLKWCILTSANLSRAAWGEWQKKGTQLAVRSYEFGVLYDGDSFIHHTEGSAFSVTSSKPLPIPSSVDGDGLVEVHIELGPGSKIEDGPTLFLPYDPLNPVPYTSTLQMQNQGTKTARCPVSTKDVPWVIDIPHIGEDALGKRSCEVPRFSSTLNAADNSLSNTEQQKLIRMCVKRSRSR